jgi:hypothetical protein
MCRRRRMRQLDQTLGKGERIMRPHWTTPILSAVALLAACDRAGERTPTAPAPGGMRQDLTAATDVPDWVGKLLFGLTVLQADPASTQEELPGLGRKFQLLDAMIKDQDPQNPTNDVISVFTTTAFPAGTGTAVRNLNPGIKIAALDHQINLKYYFPSRTCQNGGPRIQLAIDTDGNGQSNGNAFGYVGHVPFGGGCITGEWDIIDMTDNIGRWDLSQLGGGMTMTWDQAEAFISAFPNHQVLTGSLADDGCAGGGVLACGQAYYDLLTIENRTLENRQDAVK